MIIDKILNNNVVVVTYSGNEAIVMGKGIAYNKKRGCEIDIEKIDRFYVLSEVPSNN